MYIQTIVMIVTITNIYYQGIEANREVRARATEFDMTHYGSPMTRGVAATIEGINPRLGR